MQTFIIMLLICSVTMSALALLYMAVTPLLAKRYSAASCYYVWLIFIIGLIIPFRPQFHHPIVSVGMPDTTASPIIENVAPVTLPSSSPTVLHSAIPNITWWQITGIIWLAGIILFFAYHGIKHYHFLKLTARWSKDITDKQTLGLLENLKAQMDLSQKTIGLQACDSIGSPMLIGFINPRIMLPNTDFSIDELRFILKHELVHYKRKDLWYKSLVLIAAAIHWFNPIIYLIVKAINIQCELSCDAEVIRNTGTNTRQYYSETIIGVVRYQSKLKTTFSTNFYGGKKGMKSRIFSIMDTNKKKAGFSILCVVSILTLGTGAALAANKEAQDPSKNANINNEITPWIGSSFLPNPDVYAKYADFGITLSDDSTKLLYKGEPVRLFIDEKSDVEAFYLDGSGTVNLSVVRNTAGEIVGIESIPAQQAQEYQDAFFAEELGGSFPKSQNIIEVQENVPSGSNKYDQYQSFGITYSAADKVQALYFNGQRVKFFIDQPVGEAPYALWTDDAGTVNLAVIRDASGQITNIESISDKKAQEYQSAAYEYAQINSDELEKRIEDKLTNRGLEEELEARMKALYPNGIAD